MNPGKWIPKLPLFGTPICVYCGGSADTSDHTPPRCFLPKKFPTNVQAMTVPSCVACNAAFSGDEQRAAVVICTVSFTNEDRAAVAEGGWVHSAIRQDRQLGEFIRNRLGPDGVFHADNAVIETLSRVMKKTAAGLLFFEFGRLIHPSALNLVALEHVKNVHPMVLAELHRRDDSFWAEVTPSGRELERQVLATCGYLSPYMPKWRVYIPEVFEYMFLRRSNKKLLCGMKFHDAITVLLECPWPSEAGPRRTGKPRRRARRVAPGSKGTR
jgi:hypothetical protein